MLDLSQSPPPPSFGLVSAYEKEGVLQAADHDDASVYAYTMLGNGQPLIITETTENVRPALGTQDTQAAFSMKPRPPNSVAIAYKEKGLLGCLEQLSETEDGGLTGSLASTVLSLMKTSLPYIDTVTGRGNKGILNRTMSSRTQSSTSGSNITCIAWHHVTLRLAAGYSDDTVKIFSQKPLQPILKHRTQRNITQVQWLPYSMSVVCVTCDSGILLWSVDPASVVMRPSGACITLLPFTHKVANPRMTVHPFGTMVCSSSGRGVTVWDVAMVTGENIQQSGQVTHLLYSPDSTQLCVVMQKPSTLRVFKTSDWSFTEWLSDSEITSVVWSPCSQYVVFACSIPSTLFAVSPDMATNSALPLASLTATEVPDEDGEGVILGGQVKQLNWGGERLLIMFESSNCMLLLHTHTICNLKIAHGGIIKGPEDTIAISADFHLSKSHILTVVWSDNSIQHIPLVYTSRQTMTNPASINPLSP